MSLWNAFVAWTSRAEPATPVALVRIALGATTAGMLAEVWWRGLVTVLWLDEQYGGFRDLGGGNWLVRALGGPTPEVIHGVVFAGIAASMLLVVGFGTRLMALVTLVCVYSVTDLNSITGGSYDELLENGLWLLALSPCTATLSLDCRLRTGAWTDAAPRWAGARYLLVFQLVLMYWTTGLQKMSVHWTPGGQFDALYYIFQQPTWQRVDMRWVAHFFVLTQIGTAVSWFWEVLSPLWLLAMWFRLTRTRGGWFRAWSNSVDLRAIYAFVGVVFHAGLLVFMNVGPFSPVSLAYYFALFDHEEYAAVARRARRSG